MSSEPCGMRSVCTTGMQRGERCNNNRGNLWDVSTHRKSRNFLGICAKGQEREGGWVTHQD